MKVAFLLATLPTIISASPVHGASSRSLRSLPPSAVRLQSSAAIQINWAVMDLADHNASDPWSRVRLPECRKGQCHPRVVPRRPRPQRYAGGAGAELHIIDKS